MEYVELKQLQRAVPASPCMRQTVLLVNCHKELLQLSSMSPAGVLWEDGEWKDGDGKPVKGKY